jgi:hypothetical protein
MNSFLFLAHGTTLNPSVSESTMQLKVCVNQVADVFQNNNPELWELLKGQNLCTEPFETKFDSYSLFITKGLDTRTATDWAHLKPMMFTTLFLDTKDTEHLWRMEDYWKEARSCLKNRSLQGFPVNPTFRHWSSKV